MRALSLPGQTAAPAGDAARALLLRSLSYNPAKDNFSLYLDKGNAAGILPSELDAGSAEIFKYFLTGIALPNDSFWVNLRPDSPDSIIDPLLAQTGLGKVLLEADLQLKKDTARMTSPETPEGKQYWDSLFRKAQELFGSQQVSVPTLTRPWIVPDEIVVREDGASAYIYKATMKVMMEQDYIKDTKSPGYQDTRMRQYAFGDERMKELNVYAAKLMRTLILPHLSRQVNTEARYAQLRQVYFSLILAQWYKARQTGGASAFARRIDSRDLSGLAVKEPYSVAAYFKAYKDNFAQGEYNLKGPAFTPFGKTVRSYFSGGFQMPSVVPNAPGEPVPGQPNVTFMPSATGGVPLKGLVSREMPQGPGTGAGAGEEETPADEAGGEVLHFDALELTGIHSSVNPIREKSARRNQVEAIPGSSLRGAGGKAVFQMVPEELWDIAIELDMTEEEVGRLLDDALTQLEREGIDTAALRNRQIMLALLDERNSTNLFEDCRQNGFIGINRVFLEIAKKDRVLGRMLLRVGLAHELRHEAGISDERLSQDADAMAALLAQAGRTARSLVVSLSGRFNNDAFLDALMRAEAEGAAQMRAAESAPLSRQDAVQWLEGIALRVSGQRRAGTEDPLRYVQRVARDYPRMIQDLLSLLSRRLKYLEEGHAEYISFDSLATLDEVTQMERFPRAARAAAVDQQVGQAVDLVLRLDALLQRDNWRHNAIREEMRKIFRGAPRPLRDYRIRALWAFGEMIPAIGAHNARVISTMLSSAYERDPLATTAALVQTVHLLAEFDTFKDVGLRFLGRERFLELRQRPREFDEARLRIAGNLGAALQNLPAAARKDVLSRPEIAAFMNRIASQASGKYVEDVRKADDAVSTALTGFIYFGDSVPSGELTRLRNMGEQAMGTIQRLHNELWRQDLQARGEGGDDWAGLFSEIVGQMYEPPAVPVDVDGLIGEAIRQVQELREATGRMGATVVGSEGRLDDVLRLLDTALEFLRKGQSGGGSGYNRDLSVIDASQGFAGAERHAEAAIQALEADSRAFAGLGFEALDRAFLADRQVRVAGIAIVEDIEIVDIAEARMKDGIWRVGVSMAGLKERAKGLSAAEADVMVRVILAHEITEALAHRNSASDADAHVAGMLVEGHMFAADAAVRSLAQERRDALRRSLWQDRQTLMRVQFDIYGMIRHLCVYLGVIVADADLPRVVLARGGTQTSSYSPARNTITIHPSAVGKGGIYAEEIFHFMRGLFARRMGRPSRDGLDPEAGAAEEFLGRLGEDFAREALRETEFARLFPQESGRLWMDPQRLRASLRQKRKALNWLDARMQEEQRLEPKHRQVLELSKAVIADLRRIIEEAQREGASKVELFNRLKARMMAYCTEAKPIAGEEGFKFSIVPLINGMKGMLETVASYSRIDNLRASPDPAAQEEWRACDAIIRNSIEGEFEGLASTIQFIEWELENISSRLAPFLVLSNQMNHDWHFRGYVAAELFVARNHDWTEQVPQLMGMDAQAIYRQFVDVAEVDRWFKEHGEGAGEDEGPPAPGDPVSAAPGLSAADASGTAPVQRPGGIDFRTLPIVTRSAHNLGSYLNEHSFATADDSERLSRDIERMIRSGIRPSSRRIVEYAQVSSVQDALGCIAQVFLLEEKQVSSCDPLLKDLLVVLESGGTPQELIAKKTLDNNG